MASIRFFTDEDVYGAVAAQLRNAGFDAVSTPDADRLGVSDASQLLLSCEMPDLTRFLRQMLIGLVYQMHLSWYGQLKRIVCW